MAPPKIGLVDADRPAARAPLPTTDALFAQEVEQKMSNLLAGFGAVQSFLDRTKHRTATQLAAAETSPVHRSSESNLPGWEAGGLYPSTMTMAACPGPRSTARPCRRCSPRCGRAGSMSSWSTRSTG